MTTYAALIYSHDGDWTAPEEAATMQDYGAFAQAAGPAIVGGAALHPTATATTVRVTGGKGGDIVTTDGPFAEAREILSGFFLLEAENLDEAIALAAQIPGAWDGGVELRPIIPMG